MHLKHFLFYHLVCIEFIFYTKFLFFFSVLSVLAQGHVLFVQFCSGPCFVCTILLRAMFCLYNSVYLLLGNYTTCHNLHDYDTSEL